MVLLIFLASQLFKKRMNQIVDFHQLSKRWLWVMPDSFKVAVLVAFVYVGCFGLGITGAAAYIKFGNWLILLFSMVLIFAGVVFPSLATIVEGNTRVAFLGGKKAKAFPQDET